MKNKTPKEDSRLNNLDKSAEEIGMGGNLIPNIPDEKYQDVTNYIKFLKENPS